MKIYQASRVHVTEGHQMTDQTHNTAKNSHYNRRSGMKVLQNWNTVMSSDPNNSWMTSEICVFIL